MTNNNYKFGFTLVETLIVTVIITVLVAMVAGIAARIETQREEMLLRESFADINTALQHFADYGYKYSTDSNFYNPPNIDGKLHFYRSLDFPVDCNGYPWDAGTPGWNVKTVFGEALGIPPGNILIGGGTHVPDYSGSEALYYFLSQVPECQMILNKMNQVNNMNQPNRIKQQLITNEDENGEPLYIEIDGIAHPLFRFIDPWGRSIRYDYYDELSLYTYYGGRAREKSIRNFPTLTSAGPDGAFGTDDDIESRN